MSDRRPRRLVVLSGKGGTGKTVVTASLAMLAGDAALADCDVDAADLHLLLQPTVRERHRFSGGSVAVRDPDKCTGCGKCREACRFGAIGATFDVDPVACEGCRFCVHVCPDGAMKLEPHVNGEWYVSDTRCGTMVHARLGVAEENSGKLVTVVRKRAEDIGAESGAAYVIADGPPGIGCPAIAAVTGADLLLAVAEPTPAGIHDVSRLRELAARFETRMACLVNKADIDESRAGELEEWCSASGVDFVGRVPFDDAVVASVVGGRTVVESDPGPARRAIEEAWQRLQPLLDEPA